MPRALLLYCLFYLLPGCSSNEAQNFACAYPAAATAENPNTEIVGFDDCGHFDKQGEPVFSVQQQQQIRQAADNNLICVYVGTELGHYRVFYFFNDKRYETVFYDNGCDYFQEGLVRVFENGKTAFADNQLNIVLRPNTDIATSFWAGHAIVCNGPLDFEQVGEHTLQRGGNCGLINHQGELVLPMQHRLESEAFDQYIIGQNGCPPPPVIDEQQALCHARWLGKIHDYVPEGEYQHKVLELENKWQITLFSKHAKEKIIIEIKRGTAQMIIMQRQPI